MNQHKVWFVTLHVLYSLFSLSPPPPAPHLFLSFHMHPGLRVGNEILSINGEAVSDLDLRQMELLFSDRSVMLTVRMNHYGTQQPLCASWSDGDISKDPKSLLPPPNQSQLLEEFLDNFKKNTANGKRLTSHYFSPHFQYRWLVVLGTGALCVEESLWKQLSQGLFCYYLLTFLKHPMEDVS